MSYAKDRLTKRFAYWCVATSAVLASVPCAASSAIQGFVTRVETTSDFSIGSLHIQRASDTQCSVADIDLRIELQNTPFGVILSHRRFGLRIEHHPKTRRIIDCDSMKVNVGSYLELLGEKLDGGKFHLSEITLFHVSMDQTIARVGASNEEGGALIEEPATFAGSDHGILQTIWLNGYPTVTTLNTAFLLEPPEALLSFRDFGFPAFYPRWGVVPRPKDEHRSSSPLTLKPNMWVLYSYLEAQQGLDQKSASHNPKPRLLEQVRLWQNEVDAKEREYLDRNSPVVVPPNYTKHISRTLSVNRKQSSAGIELIDNQTIDKFVSDTGYSVVPDYQLHLPDSDPTKVNFHFYVGRVRRAARVDQMSELDGAFHISNELTDGVTAFPDGRILISTAVLANLTNKAQLAFLLSCAVTAILQKQSYISRESRPGGWQPEYGSNPTQLVLPLFEDEQILRIGIREMLLKGYDIREAPMTWRAAAGNVETSLPESNDRRVAISWEVAYAFNYIERFFSETDYTGLVRGKATYEELLRELRKSAPEAFMNRAISMARQ